MRGSRLFFLLLVVTASAGLAQQELAKSPGCDPLNAKPAQPRPYKDGVYRTGFGIQAPIVLEQVAAIYPPNAPAYIVEQNSATISLTVGADGNVRDIQTISRYVHDTSFDDAALLALKQFKFVAGTLDGVPVPVRIYAQTDFVAGNRLTFPVIRTRYGLGFSSTVSPGRIFPAIENDKPPDSSCAPEAELTPEAKAIGYQGVVVLGVLIAEDGQPYDAYVVRPLGMGLDEKAIEIVRYYRFKPAIKDGKPVSSRANVEISFKAH
jgi:TonB family protein